MILKLYKIRDKSTGLFSKGGGSTYNIWSKTGKTWSNIGHIKSHLHQFITSDGNKSSSYPYHNAEIIHVEIDYDGCFTSTVDDVVDVLIQKKKDYQQELIDKRKEWDKQRELKLLNELKSKYEE